MDTQSWIDVAGKVGPLTVAIAVYLATRAQNLWNIRAAVRASLVEDQKLRLSLLDRRIVAIRALRDAQREFNLPGEVTPAMIEHLYSALQVAELVFERETEAAISNVMKQAWRWKALNQQADGPNRGDEEGRRATIDTLFRVQAEMMDRLPTLINELRDASRLEPVPVLQQPETFPRRLSARFRR